MEKQLNYNLARMSYVALVTGEFCTFDILILHLVLNTAPVMNSLFNYILFCI